MATKRVGDRMVVKKADLEKKMLAYLRKAGRCIDAASVSVSAVTPASAGKPNWTITAVNYGRAPKADCDGELSRIAPLFKRYFNIAIESEPASGSEAETHADAMIDDGPDAVSVA